MRGISRKVIARGAAWSLADGDCKELTIRWSEWEAAYLAADTIPDRARALVTPAEICAVCPITTECADLAELSGHTGIAGGRDCRNGHPDTYRIRDRFKQRAKRSA